MSMADAMSVIGRPDVAAAGELTVVAAGRMKTQRCKKTFSTASAHLRHWHQPLFCCFTPAELARCSSRARRGFVTFAVLARMSSLGFIDPMWLVEIEAVRGQIGEAVLLAAYCTLRTMTCS
jgi:hypothetical protein